MVWERYCYASPKPEFFFIFFVYIFIYISANMSPFGLKFSQMILHTETSKLMYNWSFLFVVLHKPTLLPSTFNPILTGLFESKFLLGGGGGVNLTPPPLQISAPKGPIAAKFYMDVKTHVKNIAIKHFFAENGLFIICYAN